MSVIAGPVLYILIILAIAAVLVFVERLFELRRAQIDWQDFVKGVVNILMRGNVDEALAICEDTGVPVANVVAAAIRHKSDGARALREAVDSQGRAEVSRLERRLASLAIMGQVSPLLGLFGSIVGLIKTVSLVNSADLIVKTSLTSTAMDALIVAALGIAIAIPIAVMHGSLRVRLERLVVDLEAAATSIVGYLSQKEASPAKPKEMEASK